MELLFDTNPAIRLTDGFLRTVQNTPQVHPEPVIRPDTPADGYAVSAYGTVLREGGRFRSWYQAMPAHWDAKEDVSYVAYAESEDGIHWTKPELGLTDIGIGGNNICDLNLHSPSLFVDPTAPPEARYRATGFLRPEHHATASGNCGEGYYSATSADGLHWNLEEKQLWRGAIGDVITSIYHPYQKRGITALKETVRLNGIKRRSIDTAEYNDGLFSERHAALYPDEFDDICAATRGFRSADYYGMGMMAAGRGTVGFLWKFWHEPPYSGLYGDGFRNFGVFGPADISLVYQSEPGAKWFHLPGRPDFISRTRQTWSHGWVYSSSTAVEVGDEQRLYYSCRPYFHAYELDEKWQMQPEFRERVRNGTPSGITFASWPKWRLFGYESPRDGSLTLDLGVHSEPFEVLVNYTSSFGGSVRAETSHQETLSLETTVPLTGESLAAPLTWKSGTRIVPNGDKPIHLTVHLTNATLWAYEIRPAR